MMRITISVLFLAVLFVSYAQAGIEGLHRVANGLSAPIFVTYAPGDANRLFIGQRGGDIRVLHLDTGVLDPTPFLSIPSVDQEGEGGLLGMAFHPDYNTVGSPGFGRFYVNVTIDNGGDTSLGVTSPFSTHVREYTVTANPNVASIGSQREILSFVQPQTNHNGGWLGFSPNDHFLYIASGDGGGSNDTDAGHTAGTGNAQDLTSNPLGKMLRINVNGDDFTGANDPGGIKNYAIPNTNPFAGGGGDPEIWAYGLRNPFRNSFDRQTGDLWIGDVGQGSREEIDFEPGNSTGGKNYGWRLREGFIQTPGSGGGPAPAGAIDPVYDYGHVTGAFGGSVVTGGYIYRGPDPDLQGKYFFLDSRNSNSASDDNYWIFDPANPTGTVTNINSLLTADVGTHQFPVSFGEDLLGNLYIAYIGSGEVYRIEATVPEPGATAAMICGLTLLSVRLRRTLA